MSKLPTLHELAEFQLIEKLSVKKSSAESITILEKKKELDQKSKDAARVRLLSISLILSRNRAY